MATAGKSNGSNKNSNQRDNGIMESIAALRSVLMLDTPIRDVLAVGRTSNKRKDQQPQMQLQKKLCFSPTSMTQATTPASTKNNISALTENTPESKNKSFDRKTSLMSSPFFKTPTPSKLPRSPEGQLSATKVLEKKIELLEATHIELEERLQGEIDRRTTLKATYDKLSEFQTKQSSQLEQIRASRDNYRKEYNSLKTVLDLERNKHSKTIAFLKGTTTDVIQMERSKDKQAFRSETDQLRKRLQKFENRYTESETIVMSLTKEVERLNADMKKLREGHEASIQKKIDSHSREIAKYKNKLEETESGLVVQINQERKSAEENHRKLQQVQKQLSKLRDDFASEKEKMQSELTKSQTTLNDTNDARKEQEQKAHKLQGLFDETSNARKEQERKLHEALGECDRLRQQLTNDQSVRKESEEKLVTELDVAKNHVAAYEKLRSERDELERRLRDAEKNVSGLPATNGEEIIALEALRSEKIALQQQLKGAEEHRDQYQNELRETQMELDGLKQNLEEAERIEVQNEELSNRLKSLSAKLEDFEKLRERLKQYESDAKNKDESLHNLQLELEITKSLQNADAKSSNDADVSTILNLQQELEKTKKELSKSKEKLGISKKSNMNRLMDIANHREAVRDLEVNLEEMEEKLIAESPRKRSESVEHDQEAFDVIENMIVASPSKRLKTSDHVQETGDNDDDEIVL